MSSAGMLGATVEGAGTRFVVTSSVADRVKPCLFGRGLEVGAPGFVALVAPVL